MKVVNDKKLEISDSTDFLVRSIGIVVKTSADMGRDTLGLFIPRIMMGMDIRTGPREEVLNFSSQRIKNSRNRIIGSTTAKWQNYIEVPCLPIPNIPIPQYGVGERVYIDYADQDISSIAFYPYSVADMKKRKTDISSFGVNARALESDPIDDDHRYRLLMDSKDRKVIELHMSNNNGEVAEYTFLIDGTNGVITYGDGDRQAVMNTQDDLFSFRNAAGTLIQMKEGKISFLADDIEGEANNRIYLKAPTIELEADDYINTTTNSRTIDTNTIDETAREANLHHQTHREDGSRSEADYNIDVRKAPVFSIIGVAAVGGIGFNAPQGSRPPPTSASINSDGSANFAKPSFLGQAVAKAEPVTSTLSFLATQIDILYGLFGCPPAAGMTVQASSQMMASRFLKG